MTMKKKPFAWLSYLSRFRRSITTKVWLSTVALGMAVILLIFVASQLFMNSYILDNALNTNLNATVSAAKSTDSSVDSIVNRMIHICAHTSDFRYLMRRIRDNASGDKQLNTDLQEHLADLSSCHPLVQSAVLISRSGQVYSPVTHSVDTRNLTYTLGYPESSIRRITTLPLQRSPITADGWVIPMAVPLTLHFGEALLYITDDASSSDAMLYLFLDTDALNTTLNLYNNSGVNLLLDGSGRILNYAPDSPQAQIAQQCGLQTAMASWDGVQSSIRLDNWYALPQQVGQHNLYLVHLVAYETLIAPLTEIVHSLVLVALVAILVISLASMFTAAYLTGPMQQLNRAVQAIERGEYNSGMILQQKDEIGELSASVDSMYRTIQAQMDQIRHERQAKDSMEIRLFAEQINPHFLYNTLEYINLEVYNHHTQNASMMIQALGDFLRIGLNFGREQIPLQRELDHVQAYITIMNHRFGQEIGFTTDIPEALLAEPIVKIILQPLVENSIRHGFRMESSDSFIEIPTVSIRGSLNNDMLTISVIDNGTGFDVENARRIMLDDPALHKHVGLSNVYHRLKLHYGEEADIILQSIPYYKNTVSIRIPYKNAAERSKV